MISLLSLVERHAFTILTITVLGCVIGIALIPRLSLQYLPQRQQPGLSVQVQWPEASARTMEQEVVSVLEASFALVRGVESIYSISEKGKANIDLEVDTGLDLDYLRFEIASKIRYLFPELPAGVLYPSIHHVDPDKNIEDRPLLTYSLAGSAEPSELFNYAQEKLSAQIGLIHGVDRVNIQGGQNREWLIVFEEHTLDANQIYQQDIEHAIRNAFQNRDLGNTTWKGQTYAVRLQNNADAPDVTTWSTIPLRNMHGQLLYLGQIADIITSDQEPTKYYRINGKSSIRIMIYPDNLVNQLELANSVKENTSLLNKALPADYHLYLDDDSTEHLRTELSKIRQRTLLSLSILFLFLVLVYRNVRYLVMISLALVVNLALASTLYYLFEVQLHLYALAAITVSFGIIIDNAIVLSHHLYHQRNVLVFPALLASTLTTIASLVVIFFLPEKWQINLADFAKVLAINLSVSLVVALFFIPALMARLPLNLSQKQSFPGFLKKMEQWYRWILRHMINRKKLVLAATILLFGLPVFMLPNKIDGWPVYNHTLGSEWYVEHIRPTVNRMLGGTLRLFTWYVYEGAAYREPSETVLYVRASLPPGSTLDQMNHLLQQIENYLRQYPTEIKKYITHITSADQGRIAIYFSTSADFTFPFVLMNRLISHSTNMGGASWNIYGVGRGFSNAFGQRAPRFKISAYGYNEPELKKQVDIFADLLLKHPRIQEVDREADVNWYRKDRFAFTMTTDHKSLAQYGVDLNHLARELTRFDQNTQPDFYLPGRKPVRLASEKQRDNDLWLWSNKIHEVDLAKFQFSTLGSIKKEKVANAIHKEDQQYIRSIEFEYTGSHRYGTAYLDQCIDQMNKMLPLGYSLKKRDTGFRFGIRQKKQYGLLLLIIGLIFFICSIHFESFRQSIAIILLIPISFIGIFIIFYWVDGSFDQGGYTSFILISGLAVNSLILIFNDYNFFRKKYPELNNFEAYLMAFRHKFTPILLTIGSTSLGMVPFLMHGRQEVFWYALALGTMGGLLFSLLVIIFIIPVVLLKRADLPDRFSN